MVRSIVSSWLTGIMFSPVTSSPTQPAMKYGLSWLKPMPIRG